MSDSDYDRWEQREDRAFWRRRFFILSAGVVALGVCAWVFPGTHQPSARTAAATRASVAKAASHAALPPAAYGSAWPVPSPTRTPTVTASPAPATASASPASTIRKATATAKPDPSTSGGAPAACAPGDIVLSLFTSRSSYARGELPKFSVYAVSTAGRPCTLPYGAGSVQVVVTWHGHVAWDSQACKPAAAKPVQFTLGVPRVLTMTWKLGAAQPAGCGGSLPAGASGTLDSVAMMGGQSSPVHTFKLGKLAAEDDLQRLTDVFHLVDLHRGTGG